MSRYARLIARDLAATQGSTDEFVEHVYLFAPLHDIGRIVIPEGILLKPGQLDAAQRSTVQTAETMPDPSSSQVFFHPGSGIGLIGRRRPHAYSEVHDDPGVAG